MIKKTDGIVPTILARNSKQSSLTSDKYVFMLIQRTDNFYFFLKVHDYIFHALKHVDFFTNDRRIY